MRVVLLPTVPVSSKPTVNWRDVAILIVAVVVVSRQVCLFYQSQLPKMTS